MEILDVLAAIEIRFGKERFIYLDEDECWTSDLQSAKTYKIETEADENMIGELEQLHEALAWSVVREVDGTLHHLWGYNSKQKESLT